MKIAVIVMAGVLVMLAGCVPQQDRYYQKTYALPPEMSDCKVYYIESKEYQNLTVVRCPNSTTSTNYERTEGKVTKHYATITIDGVEYVQKETK